MLNILEPMLPDELFWPIAAFALLVLLGTALYDAVKGLVPPIPIIIASILVVGWLFWAHPNIIAHRLLAAFAFYATIWTLNMVWRMLYKHDALGMGDASWSFLAVLVYGWQLVVMAWGLGAILALTYLGVLNLCRKRARHVYLVPFLFGGLILAVWLQPNL